MVNKAVPQSPKTRKRGNKNGAGKMRKQKSRIYEADFGRSGQSARLVLGSLNEIKKQGNPDVNGKFCSVVPFIHINEQMIRCGHVKNGSCKRSPAGAET